jgi:hypothetical protein
MSPTNPFMALGAPPAGEDPEAQLTYLKQVVSAFAAAGNPRLKPLGKKLDQAFEHLASGAERGGDPEALARKLHAEVSALQIETYELLLTILNQARGTLRVRLQQGMPPPKRADTEKLQQALGGFAQGLRRFLSARKKGDAQAVREATKAIEEAGKLLAESGQELTAG